jgi:hypothetical protein
LGVRRTIATSFFCVLGLAAAMSFAQARPAATPNAKARPTAEPIAADAGRVDAAPAPQATSGVAPTGTNRISPLTPPASEFPLPTAAVTIDGDSAATNPRDYDRLVGEAVSLRARIAAAGDALYRARLNVKLRTSLQHAKVTRLTLLLDGGTVYSSENPVLPESPLGLYQHGIAAGKHTLTIHVFYAQKADATFTASVQTQATIEVPRDRMLDVDLRVDEDSDIADEFSKSQTGSYDLRTRLTAVARK